MFISVLRNTPLSPRGSGGGGGGGEIDEGSQTEFFVENTYSDI